MKFTNPREKYNICTSDFSFAGAIHPSNHWIVTASHCSSWLPYGTFYTCHTRDAYNNCNYQMGVMSQAYNNSVTITNDDFQTTGATGTADIWDDSGSGAAWTAAGQITPVSGDLVSLDGATSGLTRVFL